MNANRIFVSASALALLALSGCATIVTGMSQGVTVESDPSGATCSVTRGKEELAAIASTPAQVTLSKGWSDLAVDCTKEGHVASKTVVSSSFQPWTLGNILIGGVVGIVIDAGSGAITEYPKVITSLLVPSEFGSAEERDTYFESKKAGIESEASKEIEAAQARCQGSACDAAVLPIQERKKKRLAELDAQKVAVRVSSR
jgi:hypothetical protein